MMRDIGARRGTVGLLLLLLMAATPASAQALLGEHVIIDVKGTAEVKRRDRQAYVPAVYGMKVEQGDLLHLIPGARLTLVCADATLVTLTESSNLPCRVPAAPPSSGSRLSVRGGPMARVPIILSPRATKLLNARPLLRWVPVSGVNSYTLTLMDLKASDPIWSATLKDKTEFVYPADAPALVPGNPYLFQVTAGGHSSDEEGTPKRSFSVLEPEATKPVQELESRLRALKVPAETARFLVASLYFQQGLFAETLSQLEGQPEATQQAAVARLLGSAFSSTGLFRQAEPHAKKALELAQSAKDLEGQAQAEELLGDIYGALGNPAEQNQRLLNAQELYKQVKDPKKVEELQKKTAKSP